MKNHPYLEKPDSSFWKKSIALTPSSEVDPVVKAKFLIEIKDKVVTAGSCFAQHISRHLSRHGFNYFVSEPSPSVLSSDVASIFNYGVFSARYGNVYTTRQLIQLLRRAYGFFRPLDEVWLMQSGRAVDPFRPAIQPNGFSSVEELNIDRAQHFHCVRMAVEQLDVFVFTLGLTECWINQVDGAVYPICPGVLGGEFNPEIHKFINMRVGDVINDLHEVIDFIRKRNQKAKFILTVSPVPLAATATDNSVLSATIYSKSVLRVAAEEISQCYDFVAYFPSYEIIVGPHSRGRYYADDLRTITEAGVNHVMKLFMAHYGNVDKATEPSIINEKIPDTSDDKNKIMEETVKIVCEEEALA